ncbi:MAG TPA: cold shock domain-containing protein [Isosphaeraceae bacterium]|nr:cold shock domain-containing protein [Isosphaeraceae bacterium]
MPGERQRPRGTVSAWYPDRGFGFVTAEDGSGIFVHFTAIRESSEKRLWAGDEVEFDVVQAPKGLQARNLSVLHKD